MPFSKLKFVFTVAAAWLFLSGGAFAAGGHEAAADGGAGIAAPTFPLPLTVYEPAEKAKVAELGRELSLWEVLVIRIEEDPFNLMATVIFLLAVVHTFFCSKFNRIAHDAEVAHRKRLDDSGLHFPEGREPVCFKATIFHFLGEVEAVFGIWLIPLVSAIIIAPRHGWGDAVQYIDSRNFTEPMFVVVIMAIASTRPVIKFASGALKALASIGKGTPMAWWFSILTVAPLLGSFITEPAAMTISAMLLGQQFYKYEPSTRLRYATIGLLFVNISVGGTLTHFAAPPVLMVADAWHWNLPFMFSHFGWRAVIGIVISNLIYFMVFRKELLALKGHVRPEADGSEKSEPVPLWVVFVHLAFLAWTVLTLHHPAFFILAFLYFIAFTQATRHHQYQMSLRGPILVGFFLAGLVVHGGLQGWWIAPLLSRFGENALFVCATILTAFNDNAAITYLASQVPAFNPDVLVNGSLVSKEAADLLAARTLEYAVVAGAVTGGGLTVIANAPNPAGQSLLAKFFGEGGVSPLGLLAGALIPTLIMAFCFMVIPH